MGATSPELPQQHAAGHGSSSSSSSSSASSSSSSASASIAADGCAWSLNVGSAVAIVFVNKVLMSSKSGYGFSFAVTLSAIHFLTAAGCVMAAQAAGLAEKAKRMPWKGGPEWGS
ncbi:hypothetical protein OEZ86_007085 [Tetradesmus obliquus]|nr:hypothetical protein OEZ86_007085 [Tetradesmus obliquus]